MTAVIIRLFARDPARDRTGDCTASLSSSPGGSG